MYSIAPTSSPRVGCAATSTFGSRHISRAKTTRCWFPPERVHKGASGPLHWISNCSMSSFACAVIWVLLMMPCRATLSVSPRRRFSATDMLRTMPESCRSSGTTATPARAMAPGRAESTFLPSTTTSPEVSVTREESRSPSGRCPLPSTPAIPRISPWWTSRERSSK